jgi:hypothetical protein
MNVSIEDKSNTKFKLTVTAKNDVRIKLMQKSTDIERDQMTDILKSVASYIIKNNLNTKTLRGSCWPYSHSIAMFRDSGVHCITLKI